MLPHILLVVMLIISICYMSRAPENSSLTFDKQYQEQSDEDHDWYLYNKRTTGMAAKIKDEGGLQCYRIIDVPNTGVPLDHKDAPVDKGKEKFLALLEVAHKSRPLWPEEPQDLAKCQEEPTLLKTKESRKLH